MSKYGTFDANGLPIGFYDTNIHGAFGAVGSLIPSSAVALTDAQWAEFIQNQGARKWQGGAVVEYVPPLSQEQQNAIVATAVQAWLDNTAHEQPYSYNDLVAAISYVGSSNDLWNRQGLAFRAWRDAVWAKVFDIQSQVQAGTMQQPATINDFIALLPQPSIPTA